MMHDLRHAIRVLRKAPIFTATAVVTLALCIGANTAIYTVVDRMLLRPLPYLAPDRLAAVTRHVEGDGVSSDQIGQNGRTWELLHHSATKIDVAATGGTMGVNLVAGHRTEYVIQRRVSAGFFQVLGVRLARGREIAADEDRVGGPQAVVLTHGIWARVFGSDPSVVGRPIVLRGEPHIVVGVLPADFWYSQRVDVWTPLRPAPRGEGGGENYGIIARLRSGMTWGEAEGEIASLGGPLMREMYRSPNRTVRLGLIPLRRGLTQELRLPLLILLGAVAIVLFIGCVNIAGLLLAQAATRAPEMATRMALGAARRVIVRQLLAESVVLAACGGALGTAIGYGLLRALAYYLADILGRQPFTLDARVFAITAASAFALR